MKVVIPMAGMGKRMRPHTLTVPKPLLPIAGVPIVKRLVEDIATVCNEKITEIGFIVGHFGEAVENSLKEIAGSMGATAKIYYQDEALGTAHAIYCAQESLDEKTIVAFADTLFIADFKLDANQDGIIWVHKVKDPSAFGVVKLDENQHITDFVEKPKAFVSDLAIIGIYYFKDGPMLRSELKYLLDNKVMVNGEYQLTDALENMKQKGVKFTPGQVKEWLDCGNKNATVYTNQRVLEHIKESQLVAKSSKIENSVIIAPCSVGENVVIKNSVIGPYVSVGNQTTIADSVVKNSIIQTNTTIANANLINSMIGNHVDLRGKSDEASLGDFSQLG